MSESASGADRRDDYSELEPVGATKDLDGNRARVCVQHIHRASDETRTRATVELRLPGGDFSWSAETAEELAELLTQAARMIREGY